VPAGPSGADPVLAALTGKDPAALDAASSGYAPQTRQALLALLSLNGAMDVLARAQRQLPGSAALDAALAELAVLAEGCTGDAVSIDLADLHGFRYHTGITFAVYVPGLSGPLLRGGRYDDIGLAFGRARPATGFSLLDLREAARLAAVQPVHAICAPRAGPAGLEPAVTRLREQGEVVVRVGPGAEPGVALTIDRELRWRAGAWTVEPREMDAAAAGGSEKSGIHTNEHAGAGDGDGA
jgi:ATP phosphoribosyltransferase regulatory subunit